MFKQKRSKPNPPPNWFVEYMNTCVIYFKDGLMHGVDINKAVALCEKDPKKAIETLNILAEMLEDRSRKDKGAELLAGSLFVSYQLMRHQEAGLPPETIDLSVLPPELSEVRRNHPLIDTAIKYVLEK